MWMSDYPYHEFQVVKWEKENYLGDTKDPGNKFRWEIVVSKLTGMKIYGYY